MKKTAIILGITGVTGSLLAKHLFDDERFEKVISFHRRPSGLQHPKLEEHVIDMFELEKHQEAFKADVVFCCVGTTQSKTSDRETYKKIDYGIPLAAAKLCVTNDIKRLIVISALGADPESRVFYNKVKGEMERDVLAKKPKNTYFLEPALLAADREEKRVAEKIGIAAFKVLNPFLIGPLKKFRSIKPKALVKTILYLTFKTYEEARVPSDEIQKLADA
ncbi:NAD(P)H-binding protein [Leeuwenhoekiella blandensis]|uniref:Nucleoside-diphosphate-sugar epimerase n=1 Tax=Leeuwenhoekiella blandensis (strain CECT 7118 / CCUG 51940 / KCTC 22103 / MED217) TaxID=398720 RepID=A3XQL2_LEEBM|nr:NAD(P)H-binding protein [Leeuwenhoekiella blandensis]EAQ48156.1 nucleoside-diphosphate-sugar epimerase [Leeuwenhoekiella blandensis MED217]